MESGSSERDGEATRTVRGQHRAGGPPADPPANLPAQTAGGGTAPYAATDVVRHGPGATATASAGQVRHARGPAGEAGRQQDVVRYGPGVPPAPHAGQVELTAEHVWRGGGPGGPSRRRRRLGRLTGWALTVILLAVSGVLLYPRIHHSSLLITSVAITQQVHNGCGVDVTGKITTNGSAGTVSYQWLFQPSRQLPQPLSQSVLAGQHAVYVTIAVEGTGHGSTSQTVMLQVLGPDTQTASADIAVSC